MQATIQKPKPKNSSETDEISFKLEKICKNEIPMLLTRLINKSLSQRIFPDKLKVGKNLFKI